MGTTNQVSAFSAPGKRERKLAEEALEAVGLSDFFNRSFDELSGGEQQLVIVARGLAQQSKILLMDEPTASLDFGNQHKVMDTVRKLTQLGYTVLMSCHNPQHAYQFSDEVMALKDGKIEGFGSPDMIMTRELIENIYQTNVRIIDVSGEKMILPAERRCLL